jgi:hypothetical protein
MCGIQTWTWMKADISRLTVDEMRFLRSTGGQNRRERIRNEKYIENIKINKL